MSPQRRSELEERVDRLGRQAHLARTAGRPAEAERFSAEELETLDVLHASRPWDEYTQQVLAGALYNRSALLPDLGRTDEAVAAAARSVALYERLLAADPGRIAPRLADVRGRLGLLHARSGNAAAAEEHGARAVEAYRDMAARDPRLRPGLARALKQLATARFERDEPDRALHPAREALETYRRCDVADLLEGLDRGEFGTLALRVADLLAERTDHDRTDEALAAADDAVTQLSHHVRNGNGGHGPLIRAMCVKGLCKAALGDPTAEQEYVDAQFLADTWGIGIGTAAYDRLAELAEALAPTARDDSAAT